MVISDKICLEQAYGRVLLGEEKTISPSSPYGNVVLVLGAPGAGKSTLQKYGLLNLNNLVHISPDKWIELIAKNKKIDLSNPRETGNLYQKISPLWRKHSEQFISNRANRVNYFIEKLGDNLESIKRLVQQVIDLGFNLVVVLVHVNLETALRGNRERARRVPEDTIYDSYEKIENTFNYLAGMPEVKEAWRIDNDQRPNYSDFRTSNFIKKIK